MARETFLADSRAGGLIEGLVFDQAICRHLGFVKGTTAKLELFSEAPAWQYEGSDITIWPSPGDGSVMIDVKAAVDWAGSPDGGRPLKSFTLELGYQKDGAGRRGWFIDPSKQTGIYAFCWIPRVTDACAQDPSKLRKNGYCRIDALADVAECDVSFVERKRLQEAVFQELHGLAACTGRFDNVQEMLTWFYQVAEACWQRGGAALPDLGDAKRCGFVYSKHLKESPLNLKVSQRLIRSVEIAGWSTRIIRSADRWITEDWQ